MKIVEITWVDSNIAHGWTTNEANDEYIKTQSLECRSVGYLLERNEDHISLVMSRAWKYTEDEDSASSAELLTIPEVSVIKVRNLK